MLQVIPEVASKAVEGIVEAAKTVKEVSDHAIEIGKEVNEASIHELESRRSIVVSPDMLAIKELSFRSLMMNNTEALVHQIDAGKLGEATDAGEGISAEKVCLSEDEKRKIIEETG